MDQYVGADDVLDRVQYRGMRCEIADPFNMEMAVAFLLRRGLAAESAVHFIVAGAKVFDLRGSQCREWKEQSVSVITVDLVLRQNFEHHAAPEPSNCASWRRVSSRNFSNSAARSALRPRSQCERSMTLSRSRR